MEEKKKEQEKGEKIMDKQMIKITLLEYRELLLKEKPTNKSHETLERILSIIESNLEYEESEYIAIVDNLRIKREEEVVKEILFALKYIDFDRYMTMWNKTMSAEIERKAQEEKINQMNQAKELRKENRENE